MIDTFLTSHVMVKGFDPAVVKKESGSHKYQHTIAPFDSRLTHCFHSPDPGLLMTRLKLAPEDLDIDYI